MSEQNTPSTMSGMFKQLYGEKLIRNLIPENVYLYKNIQFKADKKLGDYFNQPVALGLEHGVSYGGSAGSAFTLNAAVAAATGNAKIQGVEMVLRSAMSYAAASRSIESSAAFEKGTKYLVANMLKSMIKRLEISMFYGQSGIGVVDAVTAGSNIFTVTADSWAPGIWAGMEGANIEFFSGSTQHDAYVAISSVTMSSRTIGYTPSANDTAIASSDNIFFLGAKDGSTENDMVGLYKICTNSGTLFNISGSTYSLWAGNNVSTAQDISFSAIEAAIADAVAKGLDEDVVCLVNIDHWSVLLDDVVAKRQFDSSFNKEMAVDGAKSIKFYGQNGTIEIVPSIYVKGQHCFIIPIKHFSRIGSSDVTFNLPGGNSNSFFRELSDSAGFELRCYSDQALFCDAPGKCICLTDLNVPS